MVKALSQIGKYVFAYGLGFTTGIIYTSNKYEKNPNEIFNGWGESVKNICTKKNDEENTEEATAVEE